MSIPNYKLDFIRSKRTSGLVRRNSSLLLHGYFADSNGNNIEDETLLPKIRFGGISFDDYIGMIKNNSVVVRSSIVYILYACRVGKLFGGIRSGNGHPDVFYPPRTATTGMVFVDLSNGSVYQCDRQKTWFLVASVDSSKLDHSLRVSVRDYCYRSTPLLRGETVYNIVVWYGEVSLYRIKRSSDGGTYTTTSLNEGALYGSEKSCLMLPGVFPGFSSKIQLPASRSSKQSAYREYQEWSDIAYIDYGPATTTISYPFTGSIGNPSYWLMNWSDNGIPFTKTYMRKLINGKASKQVNVNVSVDVFDLGGGIVIREVESYSGRTITAVFRDGSTQDRSWPATTRTSPYYGYTHKADGNASESGRLSVDDNGVFSYERDSEYHSVYNDGYGAQVQFANYGITLGT